MKEKSHKTSTCPGHATTTQSILVKCGKVGIKKYVIYKGCLLSSIPFPLPDLGHSDQISSYLQWFQNADFVNAQTSAGQGLLRMID